ncbi:MAG TPA: hypothetical protein VK025_02735 [Steroidobacter sp.]|jgi:hypothetical protein|nr:hypothetical protein [Steroidobacteraceae bacterium]HLS80299.1 hypothetical protein [Steroidobacter sp.]
MLDEDPPPLGELEPPVEPGEPPLGEGGVEDGVEVEDWLAQPPMSSADTALTAVTCAAITHTLRNREGRVRCDLC